MRWRILNLADLSPFPELLAPVAKIADIVSLPATQANLLENIPGFHGYFASLHARADRAVLERAENLRVIATPSTGLDHIDVAAAAERNIAILSLREDTEFLGRITATAELAWALLLAVVRRLPAAVAAANNGDWARDRFRGRQLSGKTLGILGYGRLGRIVAQYAQAFRLKVLACDIKNITPEPGVSMVDFPTLLAQSDILSLHVHLTDQTRHMIDAAAFAQMKPGAILINTSRGGIVDEAALLQALDSGHLAGAGLDVIDGEWDTDLQNHPLIRYANSHDNLIISPHIGGVTLESQRMALERTLEKLLTFIENHHAR